MHTVELFDEALAVAERLGFKIREEWLEGYGGGGCEISGQKWIFIDLSLSSRDQLEQVVGALREEPAVDDQELSPQLSPAYRSGVEADYSPPR